MPWDRYVGKTFLTHLTDSDKFPLLVIGSDRWSYQDIGAIGLAQTKACRILSAIAASMKVKSTKDFYNQTSPYILAGLHGCGVTTLYVALKVFESKKLDPDAWYVRGEKEAVRTFETLKHREQKAEQKTLEEERRRRRLRSKRQVKEQEQRVNARA